MVVSNLRVNVTVPVLNEESKLESCIATLRSFLNQHCPYEREILIADNGSSDRTLEIAETLSGLYPEVQHIHLDERGRGRALKAAWVSSDADIVSYMDVDLSTDLGAFLPMIRALADGRYHIATGSRLRRGSRVIRSWNREIISRSYNVLVRVLFPGIRISDAQCGFKALTRKAVQELIPLIENNNWFFDTELLIRAKQHGYEIFEVPVSWKENPDSRVKIMRTAWEDLQGLARVRLIKR